MRKQTIQYTTPLDALIAITKRLSLVEQAQNMISEAFFYQYSQGKMPDDALFIEWAKTIGIICPYTTQTLSR